MLCFVLCVLCFARCVWRARCAVCVRVLCVKSHIKVKSVSILTGSPALGEQYLERTLGKIFSHPGAHLVPRHPPTQLVITISSTHRGAGGAEEREPIGVTRCMACTRLPRGAPTSCGMSIGRETALLGGEDTHRTAQHTAHSTQCPESAPNYMHIDLPDRAALPQGKARSWRRKGSENTSERQCRSKYLAG